MVRQKAEIDEQRRKRMEEIYKRRKMGDMLPPPTATSTTSSTASSIAQVPIARVHQLVLDHSYFLYFIAFYFVCIFGGLFVER